MQQQQQQPQQQQELRVRGGSSGLQGRVASRRWRDWQPLSRPAEVFYVQQAADRLLGAARAHLSQGRGGSRLLHLVVAHAEPARLGGPGHGLGARACLQAAGRWMARTPSPFGGGLFARARWRRGEVAVRPYESLGTWRRRVPAAASCWVRLVLGRACVRARVLARVLAGGREGGGGSVRAAVVCGSYLCQTTRACGPHLLRAGF
jgi:hypothetical protein